MSSVNPRGTLTNDKNKIYDDDDDDDAADMRRPNPNRPLIPLHSARMMNGVISGRQMGQPQAISLARVQGVSPHKARR